MNYYRTLITVADDCPVRSSVVPTPRGTPTVAVVQYELLADRPYQLTQEDVLFLSWLERQPSAGAVTAPERVTLRERFFAKPQPCLRTSPLPKKYGFGLLSDDKGRVALCPMESDEYRRILTDPGDVTIVKAMRSSRR